MSRFFWITSAIALSIVDLGRADEACPDKDCTDDLGSLSPSLLQFKRAMQEEKVVEEEEVLEDAEVEKEDGLPVCSDLMTRTILSKESALCVPSSGGKVEYTGKICGNNRIEWMESRALDRRPGLSASQCQWDWSSHSSKSFYAGSCGVAPTVDGGDQLPVTCLASGSVGMAGKYGKSRMFCEDIKCNPIASEYQCNLAAKALDLPNVSVTHSKESGDRPPGCFVYQKGSVEFNSNLESRTDWRDTESLCSCGAEGPQVTCSCQQQGRGRGFECNDGSRGDCQVDQACIAKTSFAKGSKDACGKKPTPKPTTKPTPKPNPNPTPTPNPTPKFAVSTGYFGSEDNVRPQDTTTTTTPVGPVFRYIARWEERQDGGATAESMDDASLHDFADGVLQLLKEGEEEGEVRRADVAAAAACDKAERESTCLIGQYKVRYSLYLTCQVQKNPSWQDKKMNGFFHCLEWDLGEAREECKESADYDWKKWKNALANNPHLSDRKNIGDKLFPWGCGKEEDIKRIWESLDEQDVEDLRFWTNAQKTVSKYVRAHVSGPR